MSSCQDCRDGGELNCHHEVEPYKSPEASTDEQILTKAIEKALAGGWKFRRVDMLNAPVELAEWALNPLEPRYPSLIFNHDFAKALWGEDSNFFPDIDNWQPEWEHHLQQMVIADDPIKYLGGHL